MALESPLALNRLVIHTLNDSSKAYYFFPLIVDKNVCDSEGYSEEFGQALAQTYVEIDFRTLTMELPLYLWADLTVLDYLESLIVIPGLKGFCVPAIHLKDERWPAYAEAIANAGLSLAIEYLDAESHDLSAAQSSGVQWVVLSSHSGLVSSSIDILRSHGFKILVSDAPRSFIDNGAILGDAYLGPMYYGQRKSQHPLAPGEMQCLEALRLLSEPDANLAEVAAVFSLDPEMTIRVLHLANSAATGASRRIDSLVQAIVYLGAQRISSLVMTSMISARLSEPHAMWTVLTRAMVCRSLSRDAETAYTAGLLSALAEEVGEPSESMALRAGVSFEVSLALSSGVGDLGGLINAVRAYERADVDQIVRYGWDPVNIAEAYFRALPDTYEYLKLLNSASAA